MPVSYMPYDPEAPLLLPTTLQEWLPSGHLSHFISDTVDSLNLQAFHARYGFGGRRNQPFHPAMMVKVLLYAYCTGVFSSRKIARRLVEDVPFRVLAAGNYPAARTICDFRALHLKELEELFVQVVKIARECEMVKLGTIAVDGTKVKANASRHKAMSYSRMIQAEKDLQEEIHALLEKAGTVDRSESARPDPTQDLPAEIARREKRLQAIQEAKARLEQKQRQADQERGRTENDERKPRDKDGKPKGGTPYKRDFGIPEDKAQEGFTDPDGRMMKRNDGGFDHGYNCQGAVDRESRIVVAAEVVDCAADSGCLPMMVEATKKVVGVYPQRVLADAGYRSEEIFKEMATKPVESVVALGREGRKGSVIDREKKPHTAAMADRMATMEGRAAYRDRKWIVEPVFGWLKNVLGFRQMSMRGMSKARAEWKLACTALNLRRMHVMTMAKMA